MYYNTIDKTLDSLCPQSGGFRCTVIFSITTIEIIVCSITLIQLYVGYIITVMFLFLQIPILTVQAKFAMAEYLFVVSFSFHKCLK